ncbi:MAG: hypothetical protein M1830_004984 [Pleopsidium flavum]|nr:MAG: hypothetical protein M1830_004984 [Pleopsidium flavum]
MSPSYLSCVLCGYRIGGGHATWLNEFRAVCTEGHRWSQQYLSGVGLRTDISIATCTAPRNAEARYDDRNYEPSLSDEISPLRPYFAHGAMGPPIVFDPDQPAPEDTPWGFFFHRSCWCLLEAIFHPQDIPLRTLNDFCRSCPFMWGMLDWGHDYGGLVSFEIDQNDLLAGEENRIQNYKVTLSVYGHRTAPLSLYADPLDIPELRQCLAKSITCRQQMRDVKPPAQIVYMTAVQAGLECFSQLPPEILDNILLHLQSKDLCNLRLASRTVATMPLSQSFWASRFLPGFELATIFEVHSIEFRPQDRDWMSLYHRVKALSTIPGLLNRNRIWRILQPLVDLLTCYSCLSLTGSPSPTFYDPDVPKRHLQSWKLVGGALNEPKKSFIDGCVVLFERTVSLPKSMTGLFVSTIYFSDTQYVTGLRFVQHNESDVCLGYNVPGEEVFLDLDCHSDGENLGGFSGFQIAVGPRGIQALAVVSSTGRVSTWAGHPEGVPRMCLMARFKHISALKGGFDGFKMVTLCISDDSTDGLTRMSGTGVPSLRELAQWVPDIPPESLCLNEETFSGVHQKSLEYRPLYYVLFGGPQGIYRTKLIKLAVWMSEFGLYGIEFEYNAEVDGRRIHTLGRCGPLAEQTAMLLSQLQDNWKVSFDIDGPHDEIIETVKLARKEFQHENIKAMEIGTNRGRKALFTPDSNPSLSTIELAPLSIVTGVYVAMGQGLSFQHLGVISERVHSI